MRIVVLSCGLVAGVALVVRAVVPRRLTAAEAVLALSGGLPARRNAASALFADGVRAVLELRRVQAWLVPVDPDLAILGLTAERFVGRLVKKTAVAVLALIVVASGRLLPTVAAPAVLVLVGLTLIAILWARDVVQLHRRAEARRRTMTNVVQGLLTITLVGATTATPINEVAERALDHGHGWAYELLRTSFGQGTAANRKIYESLADLADRIDSRSLHLFADTIRTGDQEALAIASVAQRSHALQGEVATQVVARAEEHRRTLQLPIAAFAVTVVLITVGIPLIHGL